ncbi:SAM-dependent methyltransferase [Methylibium sp.]|uniref:class I SAM-dependent methyltransferase n=1 Tax=Methylibium sp. TaxID=2067992 RepID=UPI00276264B6|nr:SAM-dependent methyltransferase [Rubrivivax sp.]
MPGYLTQVQTVAVGGVDMQIRSLLDRQQFHDPEGAAERVGISSATWPLFGLVWPSALVLAAQMEHIALGTRRVLELGCGLALASLVVQRRQGRVTASDHHPLTESFLLENLRLNGLPALRYQRGDWAVADPSLGRFDLIVGSDVLYERGQPRLLSDFIERHSHDVAEVVIVDPDRGNRSAFNRHMALLGFARSERRVTQLPAGAAYKGRVLSYLRSERPVAG